MSRRQTSIRFSIRRDIGKAIVTFNRSPAQATSYTARGIFYYLCFGEQLEIPSEQRGEGRRVLVMG
jgi:hypothetical protein